MRVSLFFVFAFALVNLPARAQQNLVQNGDFSGVSIAPWTASGYAGNAKIEKYDVAGTGADEAYACNPGGQTGSPPFPPHVLQQTNILFVPILHELRFDVAAYLPPFASSAARAQLEVFIDQTKLTTLQFGPTLLNPRRQHVCVRHTPTTAGQKTLRFEFSYPGLVRIGSTPRLYVDNIELRRALSPSFWMEGERILGTKIEFRVEGTPSAAFLVLLSGARLPAPIAVPGILGWLELDLVTLTPILAGVLDAQGEFSQFIAIPKLPGFGGTPLFWQALEVGSGGASFGPSSLQAFYD